MLINVKKYLFVGLEDERDLFFQKAQENGIIDFIDSKQTPIKELPESVEKYVQALLVLRSLTPLEQEDVEDIDIADGIVDLILDLKNRLDRAHEELRTTQLEISRIKIFGKFNQEDIAYIEKVTGRKIQFFYTKSDPEFEKTLGEDVIYVGTDYGLDYFLSVGREPIVNEKVIEIQIPHPLQDLQEKEKKLIEQIHLDEQHLSKLAKYNHFLHEAIKIKFDQANLAATKNFVHHELDQTLFAVEGWVPVNKTEQLQEFAAQQNIYFEEIALNPDERVPTYMENRGTARVGEDLVHIYDTPSATDKDPSMWVLGAFALFFSMIVGDGGYGLLYLAIAGFLYYKFPQGKSSFKRFIRLMVILSTFCIIWGVLTNSFFGIILPIDSPLRKFSVLNWLVEKKMAYHIQKHDSLWKEEVHKFPDLQDVTNPVEFLKGTTVLHNGKEVNELIETLSRHVLFELALVIGILHIIISLARYTDRNWSGIGWIIFLIGAYLYLPTFMSIPTMTNYVLGVSPQVAAIQGKILLIAGISLATILGFIQHGFLVFAELTHIIQIFADVLSYLRLYALGLAGAIVSATVNGLGEAVPFAIGIVLLIIGHSLNMLLGVMSGVIHGLRLNFLEGYHYSFEGGGKRFNPLRLLSKE